MVRRFNWAKVNKEKQMKVQGIEPTDDLLPRSPDRAKTAQKGKASTGNPLRKSGALRSLKGRNRVDRSSLDLMHFVGNSIVQEKWISDKTPKSITRALAANVAKAGGLLAWAKAQPEFEELLEKKKQKKLKREAKTERKPEQTKNLKDLAQSSDAETRKIRIKHLHSEIAQAEEFIMFARKEIAKLE